MKVMMKVKRRMVLMMLVSMIVVGLTEVGFDSHLHRVD